MANQTFRFDLPLLERLEQLVNNEFNADAFFRLGKKGKLMFGHKNIISLASLVFRAQLNGNFRGAKENSRDSPIVVNDIEPEVFEEVLRFVYCEKVNLSVENMADVYYASHKYLLGGLIDICEKFFHSKVDEENALQILDNNEKHKFKAIDEACLEVICDNPLTFFEHESFLSLCFRSMQMIALSTVINCQKEHLMQAIRNWLKVNELQQQDTMDLIYLHNFSSVPTLKARQLHSSSDFYYASNPSTTLNFSAAETIFLYGLGIFIKTEAPCDGFAAVKIKVDINSSNVDVAATGTVVNIKLPLSSELSMKPVMFKKMILEPQSSCSVRCTITCANGTKLFCQNSFNPVDALEICGFKTLGSAQQAYVDEYNRRQNTTAVKSNVIAYILYNNAENRTAVKRSISKVE